MMKKKCQPQVKYFPVIVAINNEKRKSSNIEASHGDLNHFKTAAGPSNTIIWYVLMCVYVDFFFARVFII